LAPNGAKLSRGKTVAKKPQTGRQTRPGAEKSKMRARQMIFHPKKA
jgi:hypothetical protein